MGARMSTIISSNCFKVACRADISKSLLEATFSSGESLFAFRITASFYYIHFIQQTGVDSGISNTRTSHTILFFMK